MTKLRPRHKATAETIDRERLRALLLSVDETIQEVMGGRWNVSALISAAEEVGDALEILGVEID